MKVSLATHGGFAGGINIGRAPDVIDTEKLPADDARELLALVDAAVHAHPVTSPAGGRARDAMSYTISVQKHHDGPDGGSQNRDAPVELHQSDTAMTAEFAALLDWLQRHPAAE